MDQAGAQIWPDVNAAERRFVGQKRRNFDEEDAPRRKRTNLEEKCLSVVDAKDVGKDGKAPDGCVALGNVPVDKGTLREVMRFMEEMGLATLVKQRWDISSKWVCQEYIRFHRKNGVSPDHRARMVSFDKKLFARVYDLSSTGYVIGSTCSTADNELVAKYFSEVKPAHGWYVKGLADRHPKLCKVFQVLNAIFRPERPTQIKKEMAIAICKAWTSPLDEIDWAGYLSKVLCRFRDNMGGYNKCYLSSFLLHAYKKDGLLRVNEKETFFTIEGRGVQPQNRNPPCAKNSRGPQPLKRKANRCAISIVAASKKRALKPMCKSAGLPGRAQSSSPNQDRMNFAKPIRSASARTSQVNHNSAAREPMRMAIGKNVEFQPNHFSESCVAFEMHEANESSRPGPDDPKIVEKVMKRAEFQRSSFLAISGRLGCENDEEVLPRMHFMIEDSDKKQNQQKDIIERQQGKIEELKTLFQREGMRRQIAEDWVVELQGRCEDCEDHVDHLKRQQGEWESQKETHLVEARKRQEELEIFRETDRQLREQISELEQQNQILQEQSELMKAAYEKQLSDKQQSFELKLMLHRRSEEKSASLLRQSEEKAVALEIENCSVRKKLELLNSAFERFTLLAEVVRGIKSEKGWISESPGDSK